MLKEANRLDYLEAVGILLSVAIGVGYVDIFS